MIVLKKQRDGKTGRIAFRPTDVQLLCECNRVVKEPPSKVPYIQVELYGGSSLYFEDTEDRDLFDAILFHVNMESSYVDE